MKNLILVSLILQLVITVNVINGYKFGDIIAFPRGCEKKPFLTHYAIYVGPKSGIDVGQEGDQDIFHRSGAIKETADCIFGKLSDTKGIWPKEHDDNYFDGIDGFTVGSDDQIKQRILDTHKNCAKYKIFAHNCEHLATWVRYNEAHSVQTGTIVEHLFSLVNKSKNKDKGTEVLNKVNKAEDSAGGCATPGA
ncbi:uncharacterized protein LOC117266375 [Epinephelus lanceolatus]